MVGRKATYLYIESIIGVVAGYLLWLFLSKLTTPDVIGVASTIISLNTIFSTIVDLAVPTGSTRFLGKSFLERRTEDAKVLVKASLLIICLSILVCSAAIVVFKQWISPAMGFDLTVILILLIGISAIASLLRSVRIASLETKSLPIIMIISSVFRIVLAIILVLLGKGAVGITIAYLSGYVSAVVLLSFILVTSLIPIKKESTIHLYRACKSILVASVPSWIPKVMGVVGAHLGTILVFGTSGPSEAGSYFIALAIFYAIDGIKTSLFSIAFPILSAMDDQRKRFVWRLIKMSLIVSLPISFSVMLYSNEVLGLIGSDYIRGSISLKIILLSMFPLTFLVGISTLVYSYGNYWQVFSISLGSNLSRILLYFLLVPLYGSEGAAISFTLGTVIGFVVSIIIAKRIKMLILWRQLGLIFIIPAGLAFTLGYFHVIYIIGIPVILVLSIIFLLTSRVLSKSDVRESLGILPDSIGKPLIKILNKF